MTCRDGLFKSPKPEILSSPLVHRIVSEVYRLPPSLREACISQGFRLLLRKATVMIKYVEAELYALFVYRSSFFYINTINTLFYLVVIC